MRKAAASLSLSSSLIEAVRSNDLLQVQQLVELQKKKGHFADVRDDVYGNTALHWACLHGHLGMVQYLTTTMGYNVESTTRDDGSTAVLVACRYGHLAIVQWLVQDDDDDDNDVKTGDEGSDTNASCCRVKANLKVKNKNGDSALHLACRSQNLALVQYLVERQHFDMYELNKQDESALGVAKRLSKGDILKSNRVLVTAFLLQRHGLVNRINEWVTYLLERPDLLYKIKDWCCKELEGAAVVFLIPFLLPWALWQGFKAILLLFLTLSIHSNGSNSLSRNPFVLPFQLVEVVLWFPTTISTILKGGPGSYWDYVVSTLRDAIERGGTVTIVRPLARFNWIYSSYELCNHPVGAREWTALHQAVALAKSDTNGAVDGDDDDAKNAARIELVYFLVHTCQTKVEAVDQPSQQTTLHLAISRNNLKLVKCLVQDCRANLYATDKSGTTCLQYACRHGTVAMVRFLLESTCKRGSLAVTP